MIPIRLLWHGYGYHLVLLFYLGYIYSNDVHTSMRYHNRIWKIAIHWWMEGLFWIHFQITIPCEKPKKTRMRSKTKWYWKSKGKKWNYWVLLASITINQFNLLIWIIYVLYIFFAFLCLFFCKCNSYLVWQAISQRLLSSISSPLCSLLSLRCDGSRCSRLWYCVKRVGGEYK